MHGCCNVSILFTVKKQFEVKVSSIVCHAKPLAVKQQKLLFVRIPAHIMFYRALYCSIGEQGPKTRENIFMHQCIAFSRPYAVNFHSPLFLARLWTLWTFTQNKNPELGVQDFSMWLVLQLSGKSPVFCRVRVSSFCSDSYYLHFLELGSSSWTVVQTLGEICIMCFHKS